MHIRMVRLSGNRTRAFTSLYAVQGGRGVNLKVDVLLFTSNEQLTECVSWIEGKLAGTRATVSSHVRQVA